MGPAFELDVGPRRKRAARAHAYASARDDVAVREGTWEGRIVIRVGEEATVQCEVTNSSHVEARFEGALVDAATAGASDE